MLITKIANATSRRMWMNPPSVYDVATPRSQKTNKTTKIVHNMFVPISQEPVPMALAPHLELTLVFPQITHAKRSESRCLST